MSKRKRAGNVVMGICIDCNKPERARDQYIVRGNIWMVCGMGAWDAGYLHRECLEKRLGRELTEEDLLVWYEGETRDAVVIDFHPDYFTSPEYRPGPGKLSDNCLAPPDLRIFVCAGGDR